jgi:hypothetical protein
VEDLVILHTVSVLGRMMQYILLERRYRSSSLWLDFIAFKSEVGRLSASKKITINLLQG